MSDDAEQVILSNYPLSRDFRDQLTRYFGSSPRFLDVVELRRSSSLRRVFRDLRAVRAKLLSIAIEDESGNSTLPMLAVVAAVTRAKRVQWVGPQLTVTRMSRFRAAAYGLRILVESFLGLVEFHRSRRELRTLKRVARMEPKVVTISRVAYLNCNLWFGLKAGGSVGHISGVANSLMDHGLSLRLFAVGGRLLVDERALLVPLAAPSIPALPIERTHYRFNRRCIFSIGRELSSNGVGFIYQRLSIGNFTGVNLSRRFGVPLVLEYNGSEAWVAKNWGSPLRYHDTAVLTEDVALRHAHVIVTVSEVLRNELIGRGVDSNRIVTYPNCVDPKTYDPARFPAEENTRLREQLGLDPRDVVAMFVGTFGQWHGVDVLAQAIRKIVLERRNLLDTLRLRFVLVGDGLKMSTVRATLNGIGAEPYVHLTGLVPQREGPRFLAASDILLSPHVANADGSRFFGSPTKLFEYMAMGRGIVASDLDQLGDILQPAIKVQRGDQVGSDSVQSRAVAVLVEPGNVEQLIRGIELLARDGALRRTLGRNAYQLARERYTWQHHVAAILAAMNRLGLRSSAVAVPADGI